MPLWVLELWLYKYCSNYHTSIPLIMCCYYHFRQRPHSAIHNKCSIDQLFNIQLAEFSTSVSIISIRVGRSWPADIFDFQCIGAVCSVIGKALLSIMHSSHIPNITCICKQGMLAGKEMNKQKNQWLIPEFVVVTIATYRLVTANQ